MLSVHALVASSPSATLSSNSAPAVAWSAGVLRINGADHSGSGNILPGATLDTLRSASQLFLADGTRLRLGANTRISVQAHNLDLEGGAARIDSISAPDRRLNVSAGELKITASGGIIQRLTPNQIVVSAAQSTTEVRKSNGTLIAMVRPGQTIAFAVPTNAATSNETAMTGKVSRETNRFFLTDELTQVKAELQGGQPAIYQGRRVSARGELVPSGSGDPSKLMVREYAMVQQTQTDTQPPANPDSTPATPASTSPPPVNPAPTAAEKIGGWSKTTISAISASIASAAAIGSAVALVGNPNPNPISQ